MKTRHAFVMLKTQDPFATPEMFAILPTDQRFWESPDEGPNCLCSRCLQPIPEKDIAIRAWSEEEGHEVRYHPACLGFQTDALEEDEWIACGHKPMRLRRMSEETPLLSIRLTPNKID